jgi:hypothetical protein
METQRARREPEPRQRPQRKSWTSNRRTKGQRAGSSTGPRGYGRLGEALRGLLDSAGVSGVTATAATSGWSGVPSRSSSPALDVSAPVFMYGVKATATDLCSRRLRSATGLAYSTGCGGQSADSCTTVGALGESRYPRSDTPVAKVLDCLLRMLDEKRRSKRLSFRMGVVSRLVFDTRVCTHALPYLSSAAGASPRKEAPTEQGRASPLPLRRLH